MNFLRGVSYERVLLLLALVLSITFNYILWRSAQHDDLLLRIRLQEYPVYCEE